MKEKNISDSLSQAIIGYYTNSLNQEQADELLAWLGESEENRNYLIDLEKVWYASSQLSTKETDAVKAWPELLDKIKTNDVRPMRRSEFRIEKRLFFQMAAACLVILLAIGSIFVFKFTDSKPKAVFFEAFAPKGSRSFITLTDGSTVWLNSGTKLKYQSDFGKINRDLFLEGEAYFVVAKNREIPFRVNTSDVCITATGTAFNVKAYNEEGTIETTLEKGEVRIEALENSKPKTEILPVILKPNQKAVFVRLNKNLSVNSSVPNVQKSVPVSPLKIQSIPLRVENMPDTKLSTSWKDSRWIFKSEKLVNLKPILERRYDISLIFKDSVLLNYKFTGTLREESLEQVLNAICLASPIRYEISHNQVLFFEDINLRNKYRQSLIPN